MQIHSHKPLNCPVKVHEDSREVLQESISRQKFRSPCCTMALTVATTQGLPAHLATLLEQHGLTHPSEILCLTMLDLIEVLNITATEAQMVLLTVAAAAAPPYTTVASLLKQSKEEQRTAIHTGLPSLDACLQHRGLPRAVITELVGPSGAGKSQACMTFALLAAAPPPLGLGCHVIYVDTEGKFSPQRMAEITQTRLGMMHAGAQAGPGPGPGPGQGDAGHGPGNGQAATDAGTEGGAVRQVLSRILLMRPHTPDDLRRTLAALEGTVRSHSAALVIVDSIAAIARLTYQGTKESMLSRQELVGTAAAALKSLAQSCRLPVLVTNQVTARFGEGPPGGQDQAAGAGGGTLAPAPAGGGEAGEYVSPALGTLWAHSVNVRVALERQAGRRYMKLVKSPAYAEVALEYEVTPGGIREVVPPPEHLQEQVTGRIAPGNVLGMALANIPAPQHMSNDMYTEQH